MQNCFGYLASCSIFWGMIAEIKGGGGKGLTDFTTLLKVMVLGDFVGWPASGTESSWGKNTCFYKLCWQVFF